MKVAIRGDIPEKGIQILEEKFDVVQIKEKLDTENLIKFVGKADALLCLLSDQITKDVIESCPNLKVISNYAVGYNNIDLEAANERGIYVCNTPDVLTNATADLTMALLLAVSRRVVEAHKYVIDGKFKGVGTKLLLGIDLYGKKLGIIGPGRIGSAVAIRSFGFGLRIQYYSRTIKPGLNALGATMVGIEELVTTSDIIVLTAPLTPELHHILDETMLAKTKKGAIIINTGRGPLIDEKALARYLKTGHLGGAGLDVYEHEPKIEPELLEMDNVVLLPHIGSAALETRETMSVMAATSIIEALEGNVPRFAIK